MYNHQTSLLPQTFSIYFVKHSKIHKYPTRNAEIIVQPKKKSSQIDQYE